MYLSQLVIVLCISEHNCALLMAETAKIVYCLANSEGVWDVVDSIFYEVKTTIIHAECDCSELTLLKIQQCVGLVQNHQHHLNQKLVGFLRNGKVIT